MSVSSVGAAGISVVIPVMAPDVYTGAALRSIAAQTLKPAEVVIVGPVQHHERYAALANQCRLREVRLVSDPNSGLAAALNQAIDQCHHELIARMDADDIAHPERFARQYAVMRADPQLAVCGTGIRLIDEGGNPLVTQKHGGRGVRQLRSVDLLFQDPLAHPTVMLRRSLVAPIGFYRKGSIAEDYDLWLRCANRGLRMARLREVLLDYRVHRGQLSHSASGLARAEQIALTIRENLKSEHPVGAWVATTVWLARGAYAEAKKRLLASKVR